MLKNGDDVAGVKLCPMTGSGCSPMEPEGYPGPDEHHENNVAKQIHGGQA